MRSSPTSTAPEYARRVGRYQILFRRVSQDDVRIHRESWLSLGEDLSRLFWSHVVRDHLPGSFGTDSGPLK